MRNILIITTAVILCLSANAAEKTYSINPEKFQKITFTSKAATETFEGITDVVSGNLMLDPDNLSNVSGGCKVDLRTLDTGINLRNTHMKENHLHTDKFPYTEFSLKSVSGAVSLKAGQMVEFIAKGEFTLHGVTREIEIPIRAELFNDSSNTPYKNSSGVLHITGEFIIKLADYDIPLPQFLFMKLSDKQLININIWAIKGE